MSGAVPALGISLGLTLVIELGLALSLRRKGRTLLLVFLANLLTNPPVALTAILWRMYGLPYRAAAVAALELLAVGAEGLVYHTCRAELRRPYLFSLAANALSFGLGLLLRQIL